MAPRLLAKQNLRSDLFEALRDVPQLFGNAEILEKAKGLTRNPAAREALDRLATIYEIVKDYGYEKYVFFDLGLLSKFHYYTGIIFQAYTYGTGEPIVKAAATMHCCSTSERKRRRSDSVLSWNL